MLLLREGEIRGLIGPRDALEECRHAFGALARGEVVQPAVMSFDLTDRRGEVHAKGAYLRGTPTYSIKVASGFYDNPTRGLPVGSGAVWVFDAATGHLAAMLLDNGWLTELRTGAAGAVAAELLAPAEPRCAAIIGAGAQARFQLEALLLVRRPRVVVVASRTRAHAEAFAREARERFGVEVRVAATVREAVEGADLVVTVTPARSPVVLDAWVRPGTHVTAVGADLPEKQELEPALLARATVVADRLAQCLTQGEIHHAVAAGVLAPERVHAELGEIVNGTRPGRTRADEITVADLTGVGALDAAVADLVVARAAATHAGQEVA